MLLESKKTTIFDIVTHNTQPWGNPKASNVFFFFDEHLSLAHHKILKIKIKL